MKPLTARALASIGSFRPVAQTSYTHTYAYTNTHTPVSTLRRCRSYYGSTATHTSNGRNTPTSNEPVSTASQQHQSGKICKDKNHANARVDNGNKRQTLEISLESLQANHDRILRLANEDSNESTVTWRECNVIIKGWNKRGRIDRVLELWNNLPSSVLPTNDMVCAVLKTVVKARHIPDKGPQAELLFKQAQERWNKHSLSMKSKPHMQQKQQSQNLSQYSANASMYNIVMNAWSKTNTSSLNSNDKNIGQHAESWLRQMQKDGLNDSRNTAANNAATCTNQNRAAVSPDAFSYASAIHAYSRCRSPKDAQRLLNELISNEKNGIEPNVVVYTSVMSAWSRTNTNNTNIVDDAPEQVQKLFDEMVSRNISPSPQTYSVVMTTWAKSGRPDAPEQTELWMDKIREDNTILPDTFLWNILLHAWARSERPEAGRRATEIVQAMASTRSGDGSSSSSSSSITSKLYPDVTTYNTWMDAVTKSGATGAVHCVEEILRTMEKEFFAGSGVAPDALTYSAVLQSWAKSGLREAPERAQTLLQQMQQPRHDNRNSNKQAARVRLPPLNPNAQCYDAVIDCWARSGRDDATSKALGVLEAMNKSFSLKPTLRTYNAVLMALARAGEGKQAQNLLERMGRRNISPNVHCYSSVISAWANNDPPAAQSALKVLRQMSAQRECKPNIFSYSSVISAFAKIGHVEEARMLLGEITDLCERYGDSSMMPNIVTMNSVLDAFAKARTMESAEEAESLLFSGFPSIQPDVISYSTVMSAWANLGEGERAEKVLLRMEDMYAAGQKHAEANTVSYTTVIKAWAKSDDPSAAQQVERLFQQMHQHVKEGRNSVEPNHVTFKTVLAAYTKLGNDESYLRESQQVLQRMIDAYEVGDDTMKPTVYLFQLVKEALERCGDKEEAAIIAKEQTRILGI